MKTTDDYQADIDKALGYLRKTVPNSRVHTLCERINGNYHPKDAWKMIYYLTDEDYVNERHAMIFFAEKLVELL